MSQKRFFKKRNIFILFILILVWSLLIEPNILSVKKYKIRDNRLSGIRVVFAGDFHVKPYQENRLKYAVKKINAQRPDIVLLIGDYVNMHDEFLSFPINDTAKYLSNINAPFGIYTVLGNHDYFRDGVKIKKALKKEGIIVLENQSRLVKINGKPLFIAGIEDLTTAFPKIDKALRFTHGPTILLSHQPDVFPKVPKKVDLTLAGHTHGGQVSIPFFGAPIVPSKYGNKYASGMFDEDGRKMIVTKGIGTSIIPFRFNCFPDIIVIDFE